MQKQRVQRLHAFKESLHQEELILELASYGFHGATIAKRVGLKTLSRVYSICAKHGIRLRDYRDGNNKVAKRIITGITKQSVKRIS
jgi:hypothetical protein